MKELKLIVGLMLLMQQATLRVWCASSPFEPDATIDNAKQEASTGKGMLAALGKSRQLRCVRCFEDRYEDRGRYPAAGYGRNNEDRTLASNWYYQYNDRPDDRYRDYDSQRYDRYNSRGYDRGYEARDYDRGYDYRGYDRYDDRRGAYERTDARGYDKYNGYGQDRDRYFERPATRPLDYGYDRDTYDRTNYRYDFRGYRPWDETYRGESGFDNSGRGYYYNNQEDRRYLPEEDRRYLPEEDRRYLPEDNRRPNPCAMRGGNCPHSMMSEGNRGDASSQVSSNTIQSNNASPNAKGSTVLNKDADKMSQNSGMRGNESQDRDRQQNSPYGGRPPRPLGGSYFDRDSNTIGRDDTGKSKK